MNNQEKKEIIQLMQRVLRSNVFKDDYIGTSNPASLGTVNTILQTSNVVFANTNASGNLVSLYTGNTTLNIITDFDLVRLQNGQLIDEAGANIAIAPCTWANAPAAVGNTGLIVPITDISTSGYDLMISNGTRYYPLKGHVNLRIWRQQIVVTNANTNQSNNTITSFIRATLPYSNTNGSIFQNGDTIEYKIAHERSSGGPNTLYRQIYIGANSANVFNNILVDQVSTSNTNLYVAEDGELHRVNSSTACLAGRKSFDAWSGPSTTLVYKDTNSTSGIPSMDTNTTYIDFCLQFSAYNASETASLDYARLRLVASGPFDG